ncbi:hypothetical protein B0J11DRAFT_15212 [Dendryphion nanum]|uniref:Uncharacterized protein n=1 Tax=Dendryphion nanum TaxID=256645 RepID=A0A9P9EJ53_9PLEO|nr:hypothetical protein B0J11DRAFT_15212 [Dendryphion nanum]
MGVPRTLHLNTPHSSSQEDFFFFTFSNSRFPTAQHCSSTLSIEPNLRTHVSCLPPSCTYIYPPENTPTAVPTLPPINQSHSPLPLYNRQNNRFDTRPDCTVFPWRGIDLPTQSLFKSELWKGKKNPVSIKTTLFAYLASASEPHSRTRSLRHEEMSAGRKSIRKPYAPHEPRRKKKTPVGYYSFENAGTISSVNISCSYQLLFFFCHPRLDLPTSLAPSHRAPS